jgi:hypothetical protein
MLKLLMILWSLVPTSGSVGCSLKSGRSIEAFSDAGTLTLDSSPDSAVIRTAGHRIELDPTELKVDGHVCALIEESVKSVIVRVEGNRIHFTADGKAVGESLR